MESDNQRFKGKSIHLGTFDTEIEASQYYEAAILVIENGQLIKAKKHKNSSDYWGVTWHKQSKKWQANPMIDGRHTVFRITRKRRGCSPSNHRLYKNPTICLIF